MATRSLVRFARREEGVSFSEHPERVEVQVYKHYDGYPSGHPTALAEFLKDFKIVNGLGQDTHKVANGLGCLAAQYVAAFKEKSGDIYVESPDTERSWIDYVTYVWVADNKSIWMSIFNDEDECIFVGKPQELINKYEE
jgi:hypothetical protein